MSGEPFPPINPPSHQSINPPSPIRAVTFDVGGTLIEPWPSVGHVYAAVADAHGFSDLSPEFLNQRFASAWQNLQNFNYTRSEWRELVDQTFLSVTKTPVSETLFADLYGYFTRPEAWRIFDDVIAALELTASRGLRLGIISNWDERLRPLLRSLKLDRYFQTIVISCEAGACKPSPAIFQKAARELDLPPAQILHVGDSPPIDIAGASAAGFQSILLRRNEATGAGQLRSLLDLPDLLSRS